MLRAGSTAAAVLLVASSALAASTQVGAAGSTTTPAMPQPAKAVPGALAGAVDPSGLLRQLHDLKVTVHAATFHPTSGGEEVSTTSGLTAAVANGTGALSVHSRALAKGAGWTLTPVSLSRDGDTATVTAGTVVSDGGASDAGTVRQSLGPLSAWYRTDTADGAGNAGIEQGFTVAERPTGSGELVVDLQSSGQLHPSRLSVTSVALRTPTGTTAFDYGGLKVTDAKGQVVQSHFTVSGNRIGIVIDDGSATYPLTVDPYVHAGEFTSTTTTTGEAFGSALSLDNAGTTAVIGARDYCSFEPIFDCQGEVYIFTYDKTTASWQETTSIDSTLANVDDGVTTNPETVVGYSVAVSGDGKTLAFSQDIADHDVYTTWSVRVLVYKLYHTDGKPVWVYSGEASTDAGATLDVADTNFAAPQLSLALDGTGTVLAIGDPVAQGTETSPWPTHTVDETGEVDIVDTTDTTEENPDVFPFVERLVEPANDTYHCTGTAPSTSPTYCFEGSYYESTFGQTVALSGNGEHLLASDVQTAGSNTGYSLTDRVYAFHNSGNPKTPWDDTPDELSGSDVPDTYYAADDCVITGTTDTTAPYCAEVESFGAALALTTAGTTAVVGDPGHFFGQGSVYVFKNTGTNSYVQKAELLDSDGLSGAGLGSAVAVSTSGSTVLAGAPDVGLPGNGNSETAALEPTGAGPGQVDVFTAPTGGWTGQQNQNQVLTPADGENGDSFGVAVGLANQGKTVLVGAPFYFSYEEHEALPPGAVYSFSLATPTTTTLTATRTATKKALPTLSNGAVQATTDQGVTLTATVTPAPTDSGGQVSFTENGDALTGCGTAAVNASGVATCTVAKTTATTVGKDPDAFVATFKGTTHFDKSTATPLNLVVVPKLDITTDDLPNVTSGSTVGFSLDADGGVGAYTWSLPVGAKPLPGTLQVFSDGELAGAVPTVTKKITEKFKVQVTDQSPSPQTDTQTLSLTVTPSTGTALKITTVSLPAAAATRAYSTTLVASGGQTPYAWSVVGTLPTGLSLNKTTGKLSGTAPAKGTYAFTVKVTGAHTSSSATKTFDLKVGSLAITTATPPTAVLTEPYRYTLAATGGTGSTTWTVVSGYTLPPGLTLDKTTGEISGAVTATPTGGFEVEVTDGAGLTAETYETIVVNSTLGIVSRSTWPAGDAGKPYALQLVADGGTGSYTWTVSTGSVPGGLTLHPTGLLSGTLTSTDRGFSTFTAKVTDGASQSKTVNASIDVFAPMTLSPTSASIEADLGKSFNSVVATRDGLVQPTGGDTYGYSWSVSAGSLPPGITLPGTIDGILKGTPTTLGTTTFTLTVTDGAGGSATEAVTFTVNPAPTITTATLPAGVVGTRYSAQLAVTGGSAPVHWTTTSGNVPGTGVTYTTGTFNGTPSTAGTYAVTYQVTDKTGATGTRSYTVTVGGPPSPPQHVTASASLGLADALTVTWTTPTSDGGQPITSYQVYAEDVLNAHTSGPQVVSAQPGGSLATSATVSGLVAGQPYVVSVTATNANGTSTRGTTGHYLAVPTGALPTSHELATSTTSTGSAVAKLGTYGQPGFISAIGDNGKGTVQVATYGADPVPVTPGVGLFYDVRVSSGATFAGRTIEYHSHGTFVGEVDNRAVTIQICGVSDEEQVQWWLPDTHKFAAVPDQSAPSGAGHCVTIFPPAADLDGTVFFVPGPPASPATGQWNVATPEDYEPSTPAVITPNETRAVLQTVSCPSTTFCLAGGQTYVNAGLPELFELVNGAETSLAADLPATTGPIDAISCTSATHCVVLTSPQGFTGADTHTARIASILTLDGTPTTPASWTTTAMPAMPTPPAPTATPHITYPPTKARFFETRTLSCPSATSCVSTGSEYAIYHDAPVGAPSFTEDSITPSVLTLSGGQWTVTFLPQPTGLTGSYDADATTSYLDALSCVAVTTCVAVGGYATGHSGTVGHEWDETLTPGTGWKEGPAPVDSGTPSGQGGFTFLRGLSCVSETHCVADGYGAWHTTGKKPTTGQGVVETLTHGTWSYQDMPWVGLLATVSCTSTTSCVAGGLLSGGPTTGPLIATLTGTTWALAPFTPGTDMGGAVEAVTSPAAGDGVAVGWTTYNSLLAYRLTLPPTVTSVTATKGPLAGGNRVVIDGTGFYQSTTFDFGTGRTATGVVCQTSVHCTAKVPAGAAVGSVSLTAANGTLSSSTAGAPTYQYLPAAPTVTKVTADTGLAGGGTAVTVTGTGFATAATATAFTFGPFHSATTVHCASATSCTVKTPKGTAGSVDVVATVGGQTSATSSADRYVYTTAVKPATTTPTPTLTKVTPATGPTAGGTTVTLTGTGFSTTATATTVTFGSGHAGTSVSCTSTTSCTAKTPADTGTVKVAVTVGGKTSATTGAPTFTYVAPVIPTPTLTKVTPATGPTAGGTTVTLTGTGFSTTSGATTVTFGSGHAGTSVSCTSTTSCTAKTPADTGTVKVAVTVGGKTSATTGAPTFTYVAPAQTTTPTTTTTTTTAPTTTTTAPTTTTTTTTAPSPPPPPNARRGYWDVAADGGVFAYATDPFLGSLPGLGVAVDNVTGLSATADGEGYWLVGADGGIYAFGGAHYLGSLPALGVVPEAPIVGIAATPDGKGYWLVGADGGVYAFGDASFYGSVPALGKVAASPIVGIAATPDGRGYWLVGADGGVYAFGDASFHGSVPALGMAPHAPVTGMAATADGRGYWLVGADGGVYAFGNAPFDGSAVGDSTATVVGIAPTVSGQGYWVAENDGATAAFGDAPAEALPAGRRLNAPMVGEGD